MDRPNVIHRIAQLKAEIERLRGVAANCAPPASSEISSLADDMDAHVSELVTFLANDPARPQSEKA